MNNTLLGLHHVTALASDPQRNVDFYTGVLGLRLVKKTINFDDPGSYHLYYGDEQGQPGTIMTFFPWPHARQGKPGTGQTSATAFSIPVAALEFWQSRLHEQGVNFSGPDPRFAEQVLTLSDPDGLPLELVAHAGADELPGSAADGIPARYAIRKFYAVTLAVTSYQRTAALLTGVLGFREAGVEGNRFRYATADGSAGTLVDLLHLPNTPQGRVAVGSVHHIAWRTPNDAAQIDWQTTLYEQGLSVSPVMDRQYFHSIYFREPNGVLFEIATDPPGFAVDEAPAHLGEQLMLPSWLEPQREQIERILPPLKPSMVS